MEFLVCVVIVLWCYIGIRLVDYYIKDDSKPVKRVRKKIHESTKHADSVKSKVKKLKKGNHTSITDIYKWVENNHLEESKKKIKKTEK